MKLRLRKKETKIVVFYIFKIKKGRSFLATFYNKQKHSTKNRDKLRPLRTLEAALDEASI